METQHANGAVVKNEPAKGTNTKVTPTSEPKKEIHKSQAEKDKAAVPKVEPPKPQPEPAKPVPIVLNLDATLKAVEILHRRSIQRDNLIARIKQLEAFEVNLATENGELEDNLYQGCRLIIEDDKKRQFVTVTPGLIRLVAQYIFNACSEKLAEIEANIVFPQA